MINIILSSKIFFLKFTIRKKNFIVHFFIYFCVREITPIFFLFLVFSYIWIHIKYREKLFLLKNGFGKYFFVILKIINSSSYFDWNN